ncbi:hypothetical protein [Luteimicrobium album]|nr:hypothetical protein [Luteimicrobium album]
MASMQPGRYRPGALRAAIERGLGVAAEHVLTVSNARVPHEEGTLERSGATSQNGTTVAISYDTPYAVRQHEDLSLRHDEGRQAKYLESALNDEARTVGDIVAQAAREALGSS